MLYWCGSISTSKTTANRGCPDVKVSDIDQDHRHPSSFCSDVIAIYHNPFGQLWYSIYSVKYDQAVFSLEVIPGTVRVVLPGIQFF